jgi:hypothetical protein
VSSGQLADSAMSNLRKSLVSQRSGSPRPSSPTPHVHPGAPLIKSNLEERLRAKFAIGEASNGTTPSASARTSPQPAQISNDMYIPPSPRSTPLPESPTLSPIALPPTTSPVQREPPPLSLGPTDMPLHAHSVQVENAEEHIPTPSEYNGTTEDPVLQQIPSFDSLAGGSDIDTIQQRLRLVERRFAGGTLRQWS